MKSIRIVLWCLVAVLAGVSAYLWMSKHQDKQVATNSSITIGSPFELVTHKNEAITRDNLIGKPHAMFFGFTHCPDICPTTLLDAAGWLKELGADSGKLGVYFFTVDPERDTPEVLNDYVNAFDPRITGVTGNAEEVAKTLKGYKVYSKKVALEDDDYTMDHSASVLLFNPDGSFEGTISYGEKSETAVAKLRRLMENS